MIALGRRSHEGDLIGKTREQLRRLHFRRDRDWLQSAFLVARSEAPVPPTRRSAPPTPKPGAPAPVD